MNLNALFPDLDLTGPQFLVEVQALQFDSRKVQAGSLFFAIRGSGQDGHDFLENVVHAQAVGLVVEDLSRVPKGFAGPVVLVENCRKALGRAAKIFWESPDEKLFVIGVTGTNGKTSTVSFIEHLFQSQNKVTGVMGTLNHRLGKRVWPTSQTTSDACSLYSRLRDFTQMNADVAALEISSHALDQSRAEGLALDVGIFTNLSRDHLDYHSDMDAYFQAKNLLFGDLLQRSTKKNRFSIVHVNEPWSSRLDLPRDSRVLSFGEGEGEFPYEIESSGLEGSRVLWESPDGVRQFLLPVFGRFHVVNALAAALAAWSSGLSIDSSLEALVSFQGVPGRMEKVRLETEEALPLVFVDFAHTSEALEQSLVSLRSCFLNEKRKLSVVFGCGGDRDTGKRPLMGEVASRLADQVFVTSDNPRSEDPQKIIDDILLGVPPEHQKKIFTEVDRKAAIFQAIRIAGEGEVILIAGKGHEASQTIGERVIPFSDQVLSAEALSIWKKQGEFE